MLLVGLFLVDMFEGMFVCLFETVFAQKKVIVVAEIFIFWTCPVYWTSCIGGSQIFTITLFLSAMNIAQDFY